MEKLTMEKRLWLKVDKNGPLHPVLGTRCWVWTGATHDGGYGFIYPGGGARRRTTHRFSLELATGKVLPKSVCVCHRCDNPPCVNPDHLFEGSASINAKDMWEKGRGKPHAFSRGAAHFKAKLTENCIAPIIVTRRAGISGVILARWFGVSRSTISNICRRKVWSYVPVELP